MFPTPSTFRSPPAGLMETTRSGGGGAACAAARWPAVDCPLPWAASTIPAVQPPTTSTAAEAQAAVFREMLITVLPPLPWAMSACDAFPVMTTHCDTTYSLCSHGLCLGCGEAADGPCLAED